MKRSLSSLIADTNVRDYEVKEININIIYESDSQARKIFDENKLEELKNSIQKNGCLLYTSPSPRDRTRSRMPSSA